MRPVALAALVLAAGCGGDSPVLPTPAPPATPEPAPPPARPPPEPVRAEASVFSEPSGARGYYAVGEQIVVYVFFDAPVIVDGYPRLRIKVGKHVRLAYFWPWEDLAPSEPYSWQRFRYRVVLDDTDEDGISIAADAFDFTEGELLNTSGIEIEVRISAVSPKHPFSDPVGAVESMNAHRVLGAGQPRVCTDERRRARTYYDAILPREWEGTPFRFDLFDHFPEAAGAGYAADQLARVRELAGWIEEQVGYPIIEVGSVVPLPENLPEGWNDRYAGSCGWREPGWMVGVQEAHLPPGRLGGGASSAQPACGIVYYWLEDGPLAPPDSPEWGRSAVVHEIFHLFGYKHTDDFRSGGVFMSKELWNGDGAVFMYPTFEDIDALRCIFPEGGR